MTEKLYKILLTMETLVSANNADRAREIAIREFKGNQLTGEVLEVRSSECTRLEDLPAGWNKHDTPHGDCSNNVQVIDFLSRRYRVVLDVRATDELPLAELEKKLLEDIGSLISFKGVTREDLVSVTEVQE